MRTNLHLERGVGQTTNKVTQWSLVCDHLRKVAVKPGDGKIFHCTKWKRLLSLSFIFTLFLKSLRNISSGSSFMMCWGSFWWYIPICLNSLPNISYWSSLIVYTGSFWWYIPICLKSLPNVTSGSSLMVSTGSFWWYIPICLKSLPNISSWASFMVRWGNFYWNIPICLKSLQITSISSGSSRMVSTCLMVHTYMFEKFAEYFLRVVIYGMLKKYLMIHTYMFEKLAEYFFWVIIYGVLKKYLKLISVQRGQGLRHRRMDRHLQSIAFTVNTCLAWPYRFNVYTIFAYE